MQKHSKPTSRRPVAGARVPLVLTRSVDVSDRTDAANQPKRGKLDYLSKPPKSQQAKAPKPARRRVEPHTFATGQYIGDGEKLTAFVWLDEDTAPKGDAANEE